MRLITQLWMLLALVLIERNIAKAEEPEVMYIDDSSGDGDDEDYSTEAPGEIGSGTTEGVPKNPTQAIVVTKPKFDNTIRILKVANKKVEFIQEYSDPNSVESQEMFDLVCSVVVASLQQNEVTSGAESCTGVSITEGSLVVKTEVTFSEDTSVSPLDVQGALQDSLSGRTMTDGATALSVDPNSISVVPAGSENDQTQVTVEKTTRKPINVKPDKPEPTPDTMPTTQRSHKGLTDNDVFFDTSPPMKPFKSTTMGNGIINSINNKQVKDPKETQNFFQMILSNPALLAALVGAVVLTLITIVLITMFLIYRVKKKDEGSYSLDEPHKVKDPTAYWKDTKEFYA